jgi:Cadherin-like
MHSLGVIVVASTLVLCAVHEQPLVLALYSAMAPGSNEVREFFVREELPAGSFVCNLVAELRLHERYDPSTVAKLRFSFLTRPQHFDRDYFSIDERSGEIHTTERLDRETLCPGGVIDCVAQYDVAIKPIEYFQIVKVGLGTEHLQMD